MQLQSMLLIDSSLKAISRMSKSPLNYWAEFAVNISFGVVMIFAGLRSNEIGLVAVVSTILLGLFLFSIDEFVKTSASDG